MTPIDPPNTPATEPMSQIIGQTSFSWSNYGNGIHGFLNGGTKLKKSVGVVVRLERAHDDGSAELKEKREPMHNNETPNEMKVAISPISYIGYKEARCIIEIPITQVGELIAHLQRAQVEYLSKRLEYEMNTAISRDHRKITIPEGTAVKAYM
jgi:hypothetical protein